MTLERWDRGKWDQAHWDGQLALAVTAALPVTVTGGDVILRVHHTYGMTAAPGAVVVNGQPANLSRSIAMAAGAGEVLVTGYDAELIIYGSIAYQLSAEPGEVLVEGQDAGASYGWSMAASAGNIVVTGYDVEMIFPDHYVMAAGVGTLKVGGYTGLVKWTAPGVLNFGRKVAHIPGRW